jgi:hypothetical protein
MNIKFNGLKYLILLVLLLALSLTACAETTTTAAITSQSKSCTLSMSVEVSNGFDQIENEYVPCTETDGVYTASGFCMIYDYVENINNLPSIEQTTETSLIKSASIDISLIEVFDSEGTLVDTWNSWEDREILETGQYFISLHIYRFSDDCDKTGYSIFVLTVN